MPDSPEFKEDGLSYEALDKLYKQLQERVTQGIIVQQQLISIRDKLDQELDRYRLIQELNQQSLSAIPFDEFAALVPEYFVQAFEQPHCIFACYHPAEDSFELLGQFGFNRQDIPPHFKMPTSFFELSEAALLSEQHNLHQALHFLKLTEGLITPLTGPDQSLNGLVICGQQEADQRFYPPIQAKAKPSFTVMAINVAYLLYQFQSTEILRKEIEERRRVERQLEAQAAELLRSNAELEQFAYVVSHDLKAPLQNLKGFTRQLMGQEQESLSDKGKEYLSIILDEVKRYENTITALLQYARLSTKPEEVLQKVDFEEVIKNVTEQLKWSIQQTKTQISLLSDLPKLPAHPFQMEQLLSNLITNAIKFTPEGRQPVILISAEKGEGNYTFAIKDNGIGLPPDANSLIFRLFKRLNPDKKKDGQGIGLSICQKIVHQHGGRIWAESAGRDKGTTFYFSLKAN